MREAEPQQSTEVVNGCINGRGGDIGVGDETET